MSVINQVLNQLEQRGTYPAPEQTMVCAVPQARRESAMPLLALGLALIAGIATWQWVQARKPVLSLSKWPALSPVEGPNAQVENIAPKAGNSPSAYELGKLTPQQQPAVVADAPVSGVLADAHPVEKVAMTSRPGIELNTVPLPSGVQTDLVQPAISRVSPNPLVVTGAPQPLVINGGNFAEDSTVTLRTSSGQVFAKRPVSSRSATQIVINPNLGKLPDTWTVEVTNSSGVSTGMFAFTVQAPLAPTTPARGTPKADNPLPAKAGAELTPPLRRSDPLAGGSKAAVDTAAGGEGKLMKQVSSMQQADAEYRKAAALMQQGRITGAVAGYETALHLDPSHDVARQALVALLLESKRGADAERVLQEGLKNKPEHIGFAMLLARLQVEHNAVEQATATLEKFLPYADAQADFQAFFAALLQRQSRHKEAITHYQIALQLAPNNGVWLMGYGISLQAVQRTDDAKDAFRRALESKTLNPELQAFVQMKIKGL